MEHTDVKESVLTEILKELEEIKSMLRVNQIKETAKWIDEVTTQSLLAVGTTTLWKLRSDGLIKYSKVGRKTFYLLESIEKFLKSNQK